MERSYSVIVFEVLRVLVPIFSVTVSLALWCSSLAFLLNPTFSVWTPAGSDFEVFFSPVPLIVTVPA